jgi:single-stranded DNA-binding protein
MNPWLLCCIAQGRLSSRTYQTQSGETRQSLDINVTDIQFLGQRGDSGGQQPAQEEYQEAEVDLPF